MKSQTPRGGKPNSYSSAAMGSSQNASGFPGQRKHSAKAASASLSTSTDLHDRLVALLATAAGKPAVATVSSGAKYKGVLLSLNVGVSGEEALSVVLLRPTLVSKPLLNEATNVDLKLPVKLVIESKDLIDIDIVHSVRPVSADTAEKTPEPAAAVAEIGTTTATTVPEPSKEVAPAGFKTDRDISAGFHFKERELQRWVPDENTPELSLEADAGGAWDQFKVNEERFGVESSYDEHLYTTKINTGAKDYEDRLRHAEKLAREIEGLASSDRHVLEERGVAVDDRGLDEEDKYSGVIQEAAVDNRGSELMAALRTGNGSVSNQPAQLVSGDEKYTTPRERAAQYHDDPAIVSSSAARKPALAEKAAANSAKASPLSIPPKPQVSEPQGEGFRLNAQSEFNALREFSANFKIPHKIPNDLLPILAKDKLKQDEILRKQMDDKSEAKTDLASPAAPAKVDVLPAAKPNPAVSPAAEPKKETPKFKLNPKAAAFTPSKPPQMSPVPPKASFYRASNNPSPRTHHQRPYSNSSSSGPGSRRHFQISAAEFFGGAESVPTAESQKKKAELFKSSFNLFATAVRKHEGKTSPLVLEKAYKTPPTWDSTVDKRYDELVIEESSGRAPSMSPVPQFMGSPIMTVPTGVPPMMAAGYMGAGGTGGKFPVSPHAQQLAGGQYQQQFHPSMMYSQFQAGVPPGQPQIMYAPPGMDPLLFPPGGFMMPGYMGSAGSMNGGVTYQGMGPQSHQAGSGSGHHHGGRRYNHHKKGSNDR